MGRPCAGSFGASQVRPGCTVTCGGDGRTVWGWVVARRSVHRCGRWRCFARWAGPDQFIRGLGRCAGLGDSEPAKLRPGLANLGTRLRRTRHLWRARRTLVCRRHPGQCARWFWPGDQLPAGQCRPGGGGARPHDSALWRIVRRSLAAVHRRRPTACAVAHRACGRLGRSVALVHPGHGPNRHGASTRLVLRRGPEPF